MGLGRGDASEGETLGDALKPNRYFPILAAVAVTACAPSELAKPPEQPPSVVVTQTTDVSATNQQFADAMKFVAAKNWPQALEALRAIMESPSFNSLSDQTRYKVQRAAGITALYHGPPNLAYAYFVRVTAMPQANFDDWMGRLLAADKLANRIDPASTLTVLMQRWPDRSKELNADYIQRVVGDAQQRPDGTASKLMRALYDAHWTLKWGIEPSEMWRDFALILLDKLQVPEAIDVSARIHDVYVLIAMRADRRFDAVVAANPAQFDIESAAERQFHDSQLAAERSPQSLELKSLVMMALLTEQRYAAMLAASDAVLTDIRSTNYPRKLFEDFNEQYPWFLNYRAIALERSGRWDEALTQLAAASRLDEGDHRNVDQLINLGDLYCALGRPKDGLAAIDRVAAGASAYGLMQMEGVRLEAAVQMGDTGQVQRSLKYLRVHRLDAPLTYQFALVVAGQTDLAARELVAQLLDTGQRQMALLSVQTFTPTPGTPWEMELNAKIHAVIAKPEVQRAIEKVGRVESYRLEGPLS